MASEVVRGIGNASLSVADFENDEEDEKATAVAYFGSDVGNKKLKLKFAKLRVIG